MALFDYEEYSIISKIWNFRFIHNRIPHVLLLLLRSRKWAKDEERAERDWMYREKLRYSKMSIWIKRERDIINVVKNEGWRSR